MPSGITGLRDLANGTAFLMPCYTDGATFCGGFAASKGITLQKYGVDVTDQGYTARVSSFMHETPQTAAIGATKSQPGGGTSQDAPAAMSGNGTFTVAGVFRRNGTGFSQVPLWSTGADSGSASSFIGLSYNNATGGPLELGWGLGNRWRFNSGWTMTAGNWYFIACTVQANGAAPVAHMWTGADGVLVDRIAGVGRTSTGGSPTQTPAVTASPLTLGLSYSGHHASASYAGLYVYGRALGQAEIGLMYQTMRTKMAARGLTLQ